MHRALPTLGHDDVVVHNYDKFTFPIPEGGYSKHGVRAIILECLWVLDYKQTLHN